MVQLGVRECLLPDDADQVEVRKVRTVIERCGVTVTTQKKGVLRKNMGAKAS